MDSLIETFHIDIKLLIAQMINFAIVISVLYFFAMKPLMKVMQDRTARIEKSLSDAKAIDTKLHQTEEERKAVLAEAKQESARIIAGALAQAEARREEMIKKAKEEIGQIINEEKGKMQREKAAVLKEIKSATAGLVADATAKVIGKSFDAKADRELIRKALSK